MKTDSGVTEEYIDVNEAWDPQRGLSCLLEAIDHPEWDAETDRDIVQLESFLTILAGRKYSVPQYV